MAYSVLFFSALSSGEIYIFLWASSFEVENMDFLLLVLLVSSLEAVAASKISTLESQRQLHIMRMFYFQAMISQFQVEGLGFVMVQFFADFEADSL